MLFVCAGISEKYLPRSSTTCAKPTVHLICEIVFWLSWHEVEFVVVPSWVIFPIFTNLYFNFESDVWTDTTKKLQRRAKARSHSTPNISESANKSSLRKRFSSLIFVSVVALVHTHQQGHASAGKAPMLGHIKLMQFKTIQYHAIQFVKSHPHVQNFFLLSIMLQIFWF